MGDPIGLISEQMNRSTIITSKIGLRYFPTRSAIFIGFRHSQYVVEKNNNVNTNSADREAKPSGRLGAIPISKGTVPALGIPIRGPIERYMIIVNNVANQGLTFFPILINPFDFATAMTPNTGKTTAVMLKNSIEEYILVPDILPTIGGKIKLPAPKKSENNIKPTIQNCFVESLFIFTNIY